MKKLFLAFLLISQVFADTVTDFTFTWNKNPEKDVVKYVVSIGDTSKAYSTKAITTDNTYTITNLTPRKYYISITAINQSGLESDPSEEVLLVISPPILPPEPLNSNRYINVQMSIDGGKTYVSIGMVPYPMIKGQKYKTTIFTKK